MFVVTDPGEVCARLRIAPEHYRLDVPFDLVLKRSSGASVDPAGGSAKGERCAGIAGTLGTENVAPSESCRMK